MFASRLKELREGKGLSQQALANRLGVSQSTVGMWESGRNRPENKRLEALATEFGVSTDYILGRAAEPEPEKKAKLPFNIVSVSALPRRKIPLIGAVAAGVPILAEEEFESVDVPGRADYALRVEGDSMEPVFFDGDIVYIHGQPDVDDGQVAVVLLDDTATLKHVYHIPNGVQLVSNNPKYPPMIMTFDDYDSIRILGLAIGFTRYF